MATYSTVKQAQTALTSALNAQVAKLSATPAKTSTPVSTPAKTSSSGSQPVPAYGSTVTDSAGRTGIAKFDPNTGLSTAPTTQSNNPSAPGYVPNRAVNNPDPNYNQGQQNLNPTAPPVAPPSTATLADQFYSQINSQLAPVIASIQESELQAEKEATSNQNFIGGMGSSSAVAGLNAEKSKLTADRDSKITSLMEWAVSQSQTSATAEHQTEYQAYQDALTRSDKQSADYVSQKQSQAQQTIKTLPTDLTDLQTNHPDIYNGLLQYFDGNENLMKADWIAGHAQQVVGDPIVVGNKITFVHIDPITGKHSTETIENPGGIPFTKDDVKVVPNQGIFVRDVSDPTGQTWKSIGGANPYYMANQAATLNSKNAMLVSRYGTAVNNITKQLFPTPANNPLNLYSNSLNYTTKLNEAHKLSTSPTTADKGPSDLELIDAAVKINNGGQQITETQVNSLFRSLNLEGKATIEGGKIIGTSALLTNAQRNAIKTLAENNIKAQKQNALNATKVISERATRAGVPAQMISTPEDIMGLSAASNPPADAGTNITEITSYGATDNGDGTYTMPDGSVVDPNQ